MGKREEQEQNETTRAAFADGTEASIAAGELPGEYWDRIQEKISAQDLVDMLMAGFDIEDRNARGVFCSLVSLEAARRGWPDGWWEDPSVVPELAEAVKWVADSVHEGA